MGLIEGVFTLVGGCSRRRGEDEDEVKAKASAFGGFISFDKRQKKRTKEKRFSRQSNLAILEVPRDFPTRHPWLGRKTPHILVRRPSGLGESTADRQKINGESTKGFALAPSLHTVTTGDTEGGGHGCPPFFDRAMEGESKNCDWARSASELCRGRPFSLVRFFLGQQKEMNPAA